MNTSDLKLEIFRKIDTLEKSKLQDLYGLLMNYTNSQRGLEEWEELSEGRRNGIVNAIDELDAGKGIAHTKMVEKFRKK